MQILRDFLLANPLGVLVLAVCSAAVWDLVKFGYSIIFNLKSRVEKEISFISKALDQFKSGSFILELMWVGIRLVVSSSMLLAVLITLGAMRTPNTTDAFPELPQFPKSWVFPTLAFIAFTFLLAGNSAYLTLRNWYFTICRPATSIDRLLRRIGKLAPAERAALEPVINDLVTKMDELGL